MSNNLAQKLVVLCKDYHIHLNNIEYTLLMLEYRYKPLS